MGWFNKESECKHKWNLIDSQLLNYYYKGSRPEAVTTMLLYECEECGQHKSQEIDGQFAHYSREQIIKKYLRWYIKEDIDYVKKVIEHYDLDSNKHE